MEIVQIPPPLHDSTKGKYGVSIGTSQALEGIFGVHDQIEYPKGDKMPYKRFNNVVINLRTLLRNLVASINAQQHDLITPDVALTLIIDEMRVIHQVVVATSHRKLKLFWYAEMYPIDQLKKRYPAAEVKRPTTPKQKVYAELETATFELLRTYIADGSIDTHHRISDRWFDFNLSSDCNPSVKYLDDRVEASLVLTHIALDLVLLPLPRMSLMESHTGKIKSQAMFNSKLKGKPENMPFDIMTIQMHGESGDTFTPQPTGVRKTLADVAKRGGWNPTTSKAKIKEDCKQKGDPNLAALVKRMYTSG